MARRCDYEINLSTLFAVFVFVLDVLVLVSFRCSFSRFLRFAFVVRVRVRVCAFFF